MKKFIILFAVISSLFIGCQMPTDSTDDYVPVVTPTQPTDDNPSNPGDETPDNPTSDNPTSDNPTSDNPTSDNPTSDNPTSDNPTSDNPTPSTIDGNTWIEINNYSTSNDLVTFIVNNGLIHSRNATISSMTSSVSTNESYKATTENNSYWGDVFYDLYWNYQYYRRRQYPNEVSVQLLSKNEPNGFTPDANDNSWYMEYYTWATTDKNFNTVNKSFTADCVVGLNNYRRASSDSNEAAIIFTKYILSCIYYNSFYSTENNRQAKASYEGLTDTGKTKWFPFAQKSKIKINEDGNTITITVRFKASDFNKNNALEDAVFYNEMNAIYNLTSKGSVITESKTIDRSEFLTESDTVSPTYNLECKFTEEVNKSDAYVEFTYVIN